MNNAYNKQVELQAHRRTLIEYLFSKARMCDWHAVSDAANDLRETEAELRIHSTYVQERDI